MTGHMTGRHWSHGLVADVWQRYDRQEHRELTIEQLMTWDRELDGEPEDVPEMPWDDVLTEERNERDVGFDDVGFDAQGRPPATDAGPRTALYDTRSAERGGG